MYYYAWLLGYLAERIDSAYKERSRRRMYYYAWLLGYLAERIG
jgi:predicted outer membrane lipoprotein